MTFKSDNEATAAQDVVDSLTELCRNKFIKAQLHSAGLEWEKGQMPPCGPGRDAGDGDTQAQFVLLKHGLIVWGGSADKGIPYNWSELAHEVFPLLGYTQE